MRKIKEVLRLKWKGGQAPYDAVFAPTLRAYVYKGG